MMAAPRCIMKLYVPGMFLVTLLACPVSIDAKSPNHPQDGLTEAEHWTIRAVLKASGLLTTETELVRIMLREPPKKDVLKWKRGTSFTREADVVARILGKTLEAVVDITKKKLTRWNVVPGVHAAALWDEALPPLVEIVKKHPQWRAALKRRGIVDQSTLVIGPISQAFTDIPQGSTRRLIKMNAFDRSGVANFFGRPIQGLIAVVDMDRKQVLRVIDTGVVPIPRGPVDYDQGSVGKLQKRPAPLRTTQSRGPGFRIDGHQVSWQNWRFHFRIDPRTGLVVSQVKYVDDGKPRSILYQGHLSELFVPYMDPSMDWRDRAYLDLAENPGGLANPLEPGLDCPSHATFIDAVVANGQGIPRRVERAACLFEFDPGSMAWRHWDFMTRRTESRASRVLVLRMIATLGNYDYVFDWVFMQDGAIRIRVGSTGIDQAKAVTRRDLRDGKGESPFGRFVAPHTVAVNHDHYFSYRLDLDIDGVQNSFLQETLKVIELPSGPRRKVWVVEPKIAKTEKEARMRMHMARPGLWRVINPAVKGAVENPVSYHIRAMGTNRSLLSVEEYPGGRGGFTSNHLWVTPRRRDELYADGKYPFPTKRNGLPQWTDRDRPIENTDIVAWYTLGFHHVVRVEDWPVMSTKWDQFEIRPYNFFDRNPAINLPK